MEILSQLLPILIYILLCILLVVLIVLGIKLIDTVDKTNAVLDDIEKKSKSLDGVFSTIDNITDAVSTVSDKVVEGISTVVSKVLNIRKKFKKEDR